MQFAYSSRMTIKSFRHLRRQANLEVLVKEFGGPSAFADLVGTPKSHISALLSGARGVGDQLAAKIERKCNRPHGWMDAQHGDEPLQHPSGLLVITNEEKDSTFAVRPSKQDIQLLADLYELLPEDREHYLQEIHAKAEQMRKHADLVLRRAGVTAPAADDHVAKHIKPAPAWEGPERRHHDVPVEKDRRGSGQPEEYLGAKQPTGGKGKTK